MPTAKVDSAGLSRWEGPGVVFVFFTVAFFPYYIKPKHLSAEGARERGAPPAAAASAVSIHVRPHLAALCGQQRNSRCLCVCESAGIGGPPRGPSWAATRAPLPLFLLSDDGASESPEENQSPREGAPPPHAVRAPCFSIMRRLSRVPLHSGPLFGGLDAAGKTTFVRRLNGNEVNSVAPTLGFSIYTFSFQGQLELIVSIQQGGVSPLRCSFRLSVWDVGGQRTIRAFWRHYFECTDGLIWVVDSADSPRMHTCKQELHRLLKEERLAGVPILILANKQDVPSALSPDEIRQELELEAMSSSRHWAVLPCSAKAGSGLLEGMQWIVSDVSSKIFVHV
ncbi:hypothetical protein Esti_003127 [Eimeria stiedai]